MSYTPEELAEFAEQQNCSVEDFEKRWIIMSGPAYYVFCNGRYLSPILRSDLDVSLPRDLAKAPIHFDTPNGNSTRKKSVPELLGDYATVARHIAADMTLKRSYYDPSTQTFHEAVCPTRPIVPKYDEQIDRWMRLLGGEQTDKLLDWVATYTDLRRQTCALYLDGPKGQGKTMLAEGLARVWGATPSRLDDVLGNFNSTLINCPLIFVDEKMPSEKLRKLSSGDLRELVGSSGRTLKRKYLPDVPLSGAIRLILAANNSKLLNFEEDLEPSDLEAIAERFLHVKTCEGAGGYLRSIGGRSGTDGWVHGDRIAAHALWLGENRKVTPGARFFVEGEITELHRHLATSGTGRSLVLEFLLRVLMQADTPALKLPVQERRGIQIGEGKLLITSAFVQSHWSTVMTAQPRPPSLRFIGNVLAGISHGLQVRITEAPQGGKAERRRHRCHDVRLDMLEHAVETLQVGDWELIQTRILRADPATSRPA